MVDPRRPTPPTPPLPVEGNIRRSQRSTREMRALSPRVEFEPGTLIEGGYRILRSLGEGGMGVVMHGIDERLQRDVAIKFIHPELIRNPVMREQLLREARAMARVRHPNLVEVYAFGQLDASPYLVMEYVPGIDLQTWLESRGADGLAVDEALGVLDQLCRGVTAMHEAGAVHRDLKPSNVLIGPGFRVAVTDLGLARRIGDAVVDESISGTPAYIAPEVVAQLSVPPELAHAVDVYALGVMAFELLTGRLPFVASNPADLLDLHLQQVAPPPSRFRAELPAVFDRVLANALVKDPAQRTASAESFRRELVSARESLAGEHRDLHVLVADDDAACREWTARLIEDAFPYASLDRASDGRVALSMALQRAPDVAIIDLSMPEMNGVELTAALRANPKTRRVPIVVITGVGGAQDWRLLHCLGATSFLVKPFEPETLTATIGRLTRT